MSRLPRREFLKLTAASALGFAGQQKPDQGVGRQWAKIAQAFCSSSPTTREAFGLLRSWCAVTEFGQTGGRRCQVHASVLHSAPMQPSRASVLTGLMPHRHGLIGLAHRGFRLRNDVLLLPKLLSQAGYSTHLFGLQHETTWDRVSELGYQHVHRPDGLSCLKVTPLLLDFLSKEPPQPFFVSVGFTETHRPFPKLEQIPPQVKVPPFLPDRRMSDEISLS